MSEDTSMEETRDRQIDVAVEVGDGWTRCLTITIPPGRVGRARAAERKRLGKRVRIKGFRRGKIPVDVLEQRYGDFLDEHVRSVLVEQAYREAVDETELRPAGAAQITNVQYAPGERLTFQAEFEIMPSVTLDRVGGFKVERDIAPITDEEVQQAIEALDGCDLKARKLKVSKARKRDNSRFNSRRGGGGGGGGGYRQSNHRRDY